MTDLEMCKAYYKFRNDGYSISLPNKDGIHSVNIVINGDFVKRIASDVSDNIHEVLMFIEGYDAGMKCREQENG